MPEDAPPPPAPGPAAEEGISTREWLLVFLKVQEKRALAYTRFNGEYQQYLAGGVEDVYNAMVAQITEEFSCLSKKVLGVEAGLRESGAPLLADVIKQVQGHEKEKLMMTCTLQVLKKNHSAGKWSWQREGGEGAATRELAGQAWANHAHTSGCGCGDEPTEEEYENALAEATRSLQVAVQRINDCIDEVRIEIADLDDM